MSWRQWSSITVQNCFQLLLNSPHVWFVVYIYANTFFPFSCGEQCELYLRLVKETVASQPDEEEDTTYDTSFNDLGEDKTYAAMGMSKTILTVRMCREAVAVS
jgi:hypothetical protein